MSKDLYIYPDIDGEEIEDVFSFGDEQPKPEFQVNIDPDDEFRISRRPTSRPVRNSQSGKIDRTPHSRPVSNGGPSYGGRNYAQSGQSTPSRQAYSQPSQGYSAPRQQQYHQSQSGQNIPQQQPTRQSGGSNQATWRAKPPVVGNYDDDLDTHPPRRTAADDVRSSGRAKTPTSKQSNRKGSGGKKFLAAIICIVLVLLLAVGGFGFSLLGKINYDDSTASGNAYVNKNELFHSSRVENILIIGSDARGDVSGMRSDTMILASIDKKNGQLKLTSFLRDSLVYIPARQENNKLNAAFSYGGAKMTIDTLEYNFKVDIDSYVIIDFEIFTTFIDALGGVDVSGITEAEVSWLKKNVPGINIKVGTSHLTGGAALWYCRVRKIDSDFKRTERQRKVIGAVIEQIKHTNPATTLKALNSVMSMITTDNSKTSLMSLGANALLRYLHYDIFQFQIPADGTWHDKYVRNVGSSLEMDIDKNSELLIDFLKTKQTKEN